MQGYARMLVVGGIVAVLALTAVAFAVAETGGGSSAGDDSAGLVTAAATDAPVVGPAEDGEADDDDGEQADDEQADGADDAGTTTALNPAGHCVELPDTSDVVQHPDKHANWTIADCEPSSDSGSPDGDDDDDTPDADEPDDDGDGDGAEKVPARNPGGVCTEVAADSDVVLHPDKHPGWTLGECDEAED